MTKTVPNLEVRLGGIYALERIARDSLNDHITVMEILCAYIRNNSPASRKRNRIDWTNLDSSNRNKWRGSIKNVEFDIQAVIDVIARRNNEQIGRETFEDYQLDISNCNLQKVDFRKGNFERALLNHNDMDLAKLKGVRLNHASMEGAALNGANLCEAEINSAQLMGAQLNRANLFMAQLNRTDVFDAAFSNANTTLTSVRSTSLILTRELKFDQVSRMYGDNSTTPIESMEEKPAHWPVEELDDLEFDQRWKAYINTSP